MERDETNKTADLLTDNTKDEQHCWDTFNIQMSWGIVEATEIDKLLHELQEEKNESNQTNQLIDISHELQCLDISMQSINSEGRNEDAGEEEALANLEELEREFESSMHLDVTIEEKEFVAEINRLESLQNVSESSSQTFQQSPGKDEIHSLGCMSETKDNIESIGNYILQEFKVPPLICRHPVPATGKDDDISNLRQILDEILQRLNRGDSQLDRILFAPDHKISKNLLKLMKTNPVYRKFLPEFPALHLRKSKIVNLFSAYKNAGLLHMLKYMKDEEQEDDWMKLITMQNIETATQNVTRLSVALHLALFVNFCQTLKSDDKQVLLDAVKGRDIRTLQHRWGNTLSKYIDHGSLCNATFALHIDFMKHCDEIVAIAFGERLGGKDGYNLLLSSVKSSLPFAFLNGASSYAAFCVDLLHEHYTAGSFHQNFKMALFSTPHKDGHINVALDTQREMDHKDAVKGFRPRSTLSSVIPRMTIIDHFTDAQNAKASLNFKKQETNKDHVKDKTVVDEQQILQIGLTSRDWKHITPVCKLLLRVDAFSMEEAVIPQNVYDNKKPILPCEILDVNSYGVGKFLIRKYAAAQKIFNLTEDNVTDTMDIEGPRQLVKKAKSGKSITMRRISGRPSIKPSMDKNETKRVSEVKKKSKVFDCLSSSMNTCQSLVNPDCTKPSVQKSTGVRKALLKALGNTYKDVKPEQLEDSLGRDKLMLNVTNSIPRSVTDTVKYASVEFAGIKFKTKATSGIQYMHHIENGILKNVQFLFPNLSCIVICEEKYSFTPDDFKSQARQKRQKAASASIAHLKYGEEILSDHKMSKSAVICTSEGKRIISNYLARNICKLNIKNDITLIVDSELLMSDCNCIEQCTCSPHAMPVKVQFSKEGGFQHSVMTDVKQRKGEAELAQVDWLLTFVKDMDNSDSVVSIVTSGDIDSILVHMFFLSLHWPRTHDGRFRNSVYILLQKSKPELYNITGIIERLEMHFKFRYSAVSLAIVCCMGGNDFIPKMNGQTHEKWMTAFLENTERLSCILSFQETSSVSPPKWAHINTDIYKATVKQLYCPKGVQSDQLTMEEVRQLSIKLPGKDFRHPSVWMPQDSALDCLVKLLDCQLEYFFTAGNHAAQLPDFLGKGCLSKGENGIVLYEFGPSSRAENLEDLLTVDENLLNAKISAIKKKKRSVPDQTPEKCGTRKRRPVMSTPIKMKGKLTPSDNTHT